MSMITKFYEDYLDKKGSFAESEKIESLLMLHIKKHDDLIIAEDMITIIRDKECEEAFRAGFRAAFRLMKEVQA